MRRSVRAATSLTSGRWKDHDNNTNKVAGIQRDQIHVLWSGRGLVSSIFGGRIKVRARLKEVHISPENRLDHQVSGQDQPRHSFYGYADTYLLLWSQRSGIWVPRPGVIPWIGECAIDSGPYPHGKRVQCLELSIYGPCHRVESTKGDGHAYRICPEYNHCHRDILIIQPKAGKPGVYQRLGAGSVIANLGSNRYVHSHDDFFHDAVMQDVILV